MVAFLVCVCVSVGVGGIQSQHTDDALRGHLGRAVV